MGRITPLPLPRRPQQIPRRPRPITRTGGSQPGGPDRLTSPTKNHDELLHHARGLDPVTLSIDGQEVIGDPGVGSYYGHPDWRRINRGTRVHASVEVDGQDQSVIGGPFMWNHHARVRVRAVELESGVVDAEHFGYRRL